MNATHLCRRVLLVLFIRRQSDEITDFMDLCASLRARPYAVLKALQSLADLDWVDPRRLRLTQPGLAAARLLAESSSGSAAAESEPPPPGLARCAA